MPQVRDEGDDGDQSQRQAAADTEQDGRDNDGQVAGPPVDVMEDELVTGRDRVQHADEENEQDQEDEGEPLPV